MVNELSDPTAGESAVAVRADGLEIYFASARTGTIGGDDIWVARRVTTSDPFGALSNATELNSSLNDYPTWVSADGCRILFASSRPGGQGDRDIWFAERPK
jgi:Tol biopolymer transport system component